MNHWILPPTTTGCWVTTFNVFHNFSTKPPNFQLMLLICFLIYQNILNCFVVPKTWGENHSNYFKIIILFSLLNLIHSIKAIEKNLIFSLNFGLKMSLNSLLQGKLKEFKDSRIQVHCYIPENRIWFLYTYE